MELQKTLAELWSKGKNALAGMQGQAPQDMVAPNIGGDVWAPPAGSGFKAAGYQRDDFGNFYRVGPDGTATQFDPGATGLADLTKAGMPMATESAAVNTANAQPVPATNALGSEKARTVTNALASALAAGQANKPKLTQAPASSAGSVLQPKNTLLDLLAQTAVRRSK